MWIPRRLILFVNNVARDLSEKKRRLNMRMKLVIRRSDRYQLRRIKAWLGFGGRVYYLVDVA